jgi:hypothetical protein
MKAKLSARRPILSHKPLTIYLRSFIAAALTLSTFAVMGQDQQTNKVLRPSMESLRPLLGVWAGKATFTSKQPPFNEPLDCSLKVEMAVQGHYFQITNNLLVPGTHIPEETLEMLTFAPQQGLFEAWSFNNSNPGARFLTGVLDHFTKTAGKENPYNAEKYKKEVDGPVYTRLTLSGYPEQAAGEINAYREVITYDSLTEFTYTFLNRRQDTWDVVYTATFTRTKPTAPASGGAS